MGPRRSGRARSHSDTTHGAPGPRLPVCFQEDRASKPSTGSSCFLNVTPQGRQVSCPQVPKDSQEAEEECWSSKNRKKLPVVQVDTQNVLGPTLRPQAQAALGMYVCSLHATPPEGKATAHACAEEMCLAAQGTLGDPQGNCTRPQWTGNNGGQRGRHSHMGPGSRPSPRGWWELRLATDLWRGATVMDVPPRSCCMGPPCWLDGAGRPRAAPRSWEARW